MSDVADPEMAAANEAGSRLRQLVAEFVAEARPQHPAALTLDSSFERDLGLDSLARVELLLRTERAFRSGAFAVAARAGVAVLPVAIRGAHLLPRDAVRAEILKHCGEPDLAG